jgi:hypothetical protein
MPNLQFSAPVELKAADGTPGKRPTFSILAYTGGPMRVSGWNAPVILELSGIQAAGERLPVLRGHDESRVIGQADKIQIDSSGVHLGGIITGDNADAAEIITHAKNGFAWQASIGASPDRQEFLEAGKKATVNAREVTGPLTIIRAATLRETSFVPIGADPRTSVSVEAKRKGMTMPDITTPTDTAVDPIVTERERVTSIIRVCAGQHADIQGQALAAGWTLEQVKASLYDSTSSAAELATIRGNRGQKYLNAGGMATGAGAMSMASPQDVLVASAMMMGGHADMIIKAFPDGERLANSLRRPRGWQDLATMHLMAAGADVPHDRHELIKAAASTTSMPATLGLASQKIALQFFQDASRNYLAISRPVVAVDFKANKAIRISAGSRLEPLGPAGEIKHGDIMEDAFTYTVSTYAKMFGLTRAAIINDDASILSEIPQVLGSESARSVSDTYFTMLTGNAGSFFGSTNANQMTASSALAIGTLATAVQKLRTRTDRDKRIIGFQPTTLLVPATLEQTARAVLHSTFLFRSTATADDMPAGNPFEGSNIDMIVEPRLDAISTTAWYLFAEPSYAPTLVAFLGDGNMRGPHVESSMDEFEYLGVKFRAYLDYGCALGEYRAAVMATGAA